MWALFVGTCARNGTSATAVLKDALRSYLLENGTTSDELDGLVQADLRDLHNEHHPTTEPAGTRA